MQTDRNAIDDGRIQAWRLSFWVFFLRDGQSAKSVLFSPWRKISTSQLRIMSDVYKTEKSTLTLLEGGIIEHTYEEGVTIDEDEARRVIDIVIDMIGEGGHLLLLNDMRIKALFTREARAFFRENTPDNASVAFIINSKLGEVTVNFFLKFNSPTYNLRIFNDREEAFTWLREMGAAHAKA
jgi:hypothetical protein